MAKDQLTEYVIENQQKFYRIAYCYVKDKDRVLDIVQNMICKVFEKYEVAPGFMGQQEFEIVNPTLTNYKSKLYNHP